MYKFSEETVKHAHFEDSLWDNNQSQNKCITVKRQSNDDIHTWKLFENNECKLVINSSDITKKMTNFLFTANGLSFLISQYKSGCNNLYKFKKAVKEHVKNIN